MTTDTNKPIVVSFGADVERFNREIVGYPIPASPHCLDEARKGFRVGHIGEELQEFIQATEANDIDGATDAIIDLVYVALGALVEMGVCIQPVFAEVHEANMRKVQGSRSKRPGSQGFDAIKPNGWKAPDHAWLAEVTPEEMAEVRAKVEARMVARTEGITDVRIGDTPLNACAEVTSKPAMDPTLAMTIDQVPRILREVAQLRVQKGNDYNTGIELKDYFPFGHQSYAQMLHVKNLRVRSLITVAQGGGKPNFEGLIDSLKDIINYASYYAEAIQRGDLNDLSAAKAGR